MKCIIFSCIFAALISVAVSGMAPLPKDLGRCNYICQDPDVPVCATNGICFDRFTSLCKLQTYNCLNPQRQFQQLPDEKCKDIAQPLCTRGDFQ